MNVYLRIEDLQYDLSPKPPVNEKKWNKEKWIIEHPIDYYKMMYVLYQIENSFLQESAFKRLYEIIRLYIPNTLYKYYSLSEDADSNAKRFDTLANRQIYLAEISGFNDPFDSKSFFYQPSRITNAESQPCFDDRVIDDFTAFIRSAALSANGVQSMPMWAHYGNNHTGFCASYDMKNNSELSMSTFPVQYTDKRLDISCIMDNYIQKLYEAVEQDIDMDFESVFRNDMRIIYATLLLNNVKHSSWSYENEFRCTLASNSTGVPFIEATPKEIYIGMKCSEKDTNQLKTIGNQLNIPVYKMYFDDYSHEYRLKLRSLN